MKKIAHTGKKRDVNQLAAAIVRAATSEEPEALAPVDPTKNPAAVALGRLGGSKGGRARAASLSPRRRKQIARKAAQARWQKRQVKTVSND
jgi:hypothetical protein